MSANGVIILETGAVPHIEESFMRIRQQIFIIEVLLVEIGIGKPIYMAYFPC